MRLALALILLLLAPVAAAQAPASPLTLIADSSDHGPCFPEELSVCFVRAWRDESLGNWTLDARQRYERVAVGGNFSEFPVIAAYLPSYALYVEGEEFFVEYDVLDRVVGVYHTIPQDRPHRDALGLDLSRDNFSIYLDSPSVTDPLGPYGNRSYGIDMSNGTNGFSYDRAGPYSAEVGYTSDDWIDDISFVCDFANDSICFELTSKVINESTGATPNAIIGLDWEDVALATNDSLLQDNSSGFSLTTSVTNESRRQAQNGPTLQIGSSSSLQPRQLELQSGPSTTLPPGPQPLPEAEPERALVTQAIPAVPPVSRVPPVIWLVNGLGAIALAYLLYSRLGGPAGALAHPLRTAIHEYLKTHPRAQLPVIANATGHAESTVRYHLRILEREDIVRRAKILDHTLFFLTARRPPIGTPALHISAHPTRGPIIHILASHPAGLTRQEIHELAAHVPLRTRNHTLKRLIQLGAIEQVGEGMSVRLVLARPAFAQVSAMSADVARNPLS